ncbi:MAG: hypothetical protein IJB70_09900 [Clostridia bacterium]|nr:hypothetical protein [Clostridia bacterium]
MREQINILKYGFFLFLLIVGIVSIFNQEANFVNAINSLSIPMFSLSLSIIFVKANKYARDEVFKKMISQEKIVDQKAKEVNKMSEQIEKAEGNEKINLYKKFEELHNNSLISMKEMSFLCKYFSTIDFFTKLFNIVAMLSLIWCLLSLVGLFTLNVNFAWINIFSLAIVFFDFFVLDDLLIKTFKKRFDKLHEQAEKEIAQEASQQEEKLNEV